MFNWDMLVPIAGMATGLILILPIVRAGVRYLERRGSASEREELADVREELRVLTDRLDAADTQGARIAELEERVDFAERMLAQRNEAPRIGGSD